MSVRRVSNSTIAQALRDMALYLEMDDVPFKPDAYRSAADSVMAMDQDLSEVYRKGGVKALNDLPSIGKGIAERMANMIETGRMDDLETMHRQTPPGVLTLTRIEGIGPKRARLLWQKLGVRSIAELAKAARAGRVAKVPGLGARSEQKILEAIEFLQEQPSGRIPLDKALPMARRIERALSVVPGTKRVVVAGSIRRMRSTIGDIDVLVCADDPEAVADAFERMPEVHAVLARGPTKTMVQLEGGIDCDLRVIPLESFGAALLYFTGSKAHNVALRKLAIKLGYKLNEYGLFKGDTLIAGRTEEDVYAALGLDWIEPRLRVDQGEIERASRSGDVAALLRSPAVPASPR